jgi:hypothetical protein
MEDLLVFVFVFHNKSLSLDPLLGPLISVTFLILLPLGKERAAVE